jgi:hypothetical protein
VQRAKHHSSRLSFWFEAFFWRELNRNSKQTLMLGFSLSWLEGAITRNHQSFDYDHYIWTQRTVALLRYVKCRLKLPYFQVRQLSSSFVETLWWFFSRWSSSYLFPHPDLYDDEHFASLSAYSEQAEAGRTIFVLLVNKLYVSFSSWNRNEVILNQVSFCNIRFQLFDS